MFTISKYISHFKFCSTVSQCHNIHINFPFPVSLQTLSTRSWQPTWDPWWCWTCATDMRWSETARFRAPTACLSLSWRTPLSWTPLPSKHSMDSRSPPPSRLWWRTATRGGGRGRPGMLSPRKDYGPGEIIEDWFTLSVQPWSSHDPIKYRLHAFQWKHTHWPSRSVPASFPLQSRSFPKIF